MPLIVIGKCNIIKSDVFAACIIVESLQSGDERSPERNEPVGRICAAFFTCRSGKL